MRRIINGRVYDTDTAKLLADNVGMDFVANMGKVINQFLSQHAQQC